MHARIGRPRYTLVLASRSAATRNNSGTVRACILSRSGRITALPGGLRPRKAWEGRGETHVHPSDAGAARGAAPVGNGNGIKAFGGTFSLVVNP